MGLNSGQTLKLIILPLFISNYWSKMDCVFLKKSRDIFKKPHKLQSTYRFPHYREFIFIYIRNTIKYIG